MGLPPEFRNNSRRNSTEARNLGKRGRQCDIELWHKKWICQLPTYISAQALKLARRSVPQGCVDRRAVGTVRRKCFEVVLQIVMDLL